MGEHTRSPRAGFISAGLVLNHCWLQRMRQFKASRSIKHKRSLVRFLSTMELLCGLPTLPRLQSGHRHSNEVSVLSALALPYFQPRILLDGLRNKIGSVENPKFSTHRDLQRKILRDHGGGVNSWKTKLCSQVKRASRGNVPTSPSLSA
jgi:hypothetical protein